MGPYSYISHSFVVLTNFAVDPVIFTPRIQLNIYALSTLVILRHISQISSAASALTTCNDLPADIIPQR